MAIKLKADKTYTDIYGNNYIDSLYGVVDHCNNNKRDKLCHFVFEAYISKDARDSSKQPLFARSYDVTGDEWETYFSVTAMADSDCYAKAYDYLKQVREPETIDEEGNTIQGALVYKDWEDLV